MRKEEVRNVGLLSRNVTRARARAIESTDKTADGAPSDSQGLSDVCKSLPPNATVNLTINYRGAFEGAHINMLSAAPAEGGFARSSPPQLSLPPSAPPPAAQLPAAPPGEYHPHHDHRQHHRAEYDQHAPRYLYYGSSRYRD